MSKSIAESDRELRGMDPNRQMNIWRAARKRRYQRDVYQ